MTIYDLFITPIYLILFYALAFMIRPAVTNRYTKPYFMPAFTVKIIGSLGFAILFNTFYGGDTTLYYRSAETVYHAFGDSFATGMKLFLLSSRNADPNMLPYVSNMAWAGRDSNEFFVIQVGTIGAMIGFNTYTVTCLFFAVLSFTGMWAMYITLAKIRPQIYRQLATAVFFLPSVFFWGSSYLKDPLCLGALGWLFYAFYRGAIEKKNLLRCTIIAIITSYAIVVTKLYILLAFLPPAVLWVFNENSQRIRSTVVRQIARPLLLIIGTGLGVIALSSMMAGDARFDIDNIGSQSKITSEYLYRVSAREEGSGYSLGEQDGTIGGMLKLAPQAIIVSLFRPFLWEAKNPTMMLSALEAAYFMFLTLRILLRVGPVAAIGAIASSPILTLCFVFSMVFAISVGVTSANFGTLVRYKIPLMPFYLSGLYILQNIAFPIAERLKHNNAISRT